MINNTKYQGSIISSKNLLEKYIDSFNKCLFEGIN